MMEEYDYLFKIVIVGKSGIGKSSIMSRFTEDTYTDSFITTIGVDFRLKTVKHSGKSVKLQLWDTAGQERFRTITTSYYRGAHAIIIAFDLTDVDYDEIISWINQIDHIRDDGVYKLLVGTKCDIAKDYDSNALKEFADSYGMGFVATSSKLDIGINTVFETIVSSLLNKIEPKSLKSKPDIQTLRLDQPKRADCCN